MHSHEPAGPCLLLSATGPALLVFSLRVRPNYRVRMAEVLAIALDFPAASFWIAELGMLSMADMSPSAVGIVHMSHALLGTCKHRCAHVPTFVL